MRVRKRILLAAALAVVGLVGQQSPPAHAVTGAASAVFVGTATFDEGMFTPVSPACGVNLCPTSGHRNWSYTTTGSGWSISLPSIAGPFYTENGWGSIGTHHTFGQGPYCGFEGSGSITTTRSWTPGLLTSHHSSSTEHWSNGAGSLLVATGTEGTSQSVTVMELVAPNPVLNGQSCLAGTATDFTIVGATVIASPS